MGKCKDCKWLNTSFRFAAGYECSKLSSFFSIPMEKRLIDCTTGDETDPFFIVAANFGCVLWEAKTEEGGI
jgi:hypothetical protein